MRLWQTNAFEDVILTRGEGSRVWDEHGRSYLDLLAGCWCAVLGHAHPRLAESARAQAATLPHTGPPFASDALHAGLAKLAEIVPPQLDRGVFLNTGSEAVELALKMARAAREADTVVVIARSYYGATTYAYALSEAGRGVNWLPPVGSVQRLPAPDCRHCPAGVQWPCNNFPCLNPLRALRDRPDTAIAAVLFEPILANAGVLTPPLGYGRALQTLAGECGALFIAEEVTTGVGRTGRWLGCDHERVVPDILVLGKALGGGLPVAAVVTTAAVEAQCAGRLSHVQSHQNDPFSGKIAATVIAVMQEERLLERAAQAGEHLLTGLQLLQARHPLIVDVRGRGLMLGVELERARADVGTRLARELLAAGFIVNYQPQNATFRLFPPYVITSEELEAFLSALDGLLAQHAE